MRDAAALQVSAAVLAPRSWVTVEVAGRRNCYACAAGGLVLRVVT